MKAVPRYRWRRRSPRVFFSCSRRILSSTVSRVISFVGGEDTGLPDAMGGGRGLRLDRRDSTKDRNDDGVGGRRDSGPDRRPLFSS